MILFTATGALSAAFAQQYPCQIISARKLNDVELTEKLELATVVIHNAALLQANVLSEYMDANYGLTKRVLDLTYKTNPKVRFINVSSMSFLETADAYLPTEKMTDYAYSKYEAEQYCNQHPLSKKHENVTNVRFSTLFYQDETRDGLSKLGFDAVHKKQISLINNGNAKRDFIPLDVAAAYLKKLTTTNVLPAVINVASGKPLSFKHLSDLILKRDPSVKSLNLEQKTVNVLSDFPIDALKELGEIEFDMDLEFAEYLSRLALKKVI